ncbi:MAG: hypothetical protein O2779_03095 [Nanoarchaeota archaeon]|nr:hypothetical protein [Nanoarchaeota archaeon]
MKIKRVLEQNDTVLQVVSKFKYRDSLCTLMKGLNGKKVCYISLNKPASNVREGLNNKNISTANTFFIDAVSASLGHNLEIDNVMYVSSPSALTELSIAIISALNGNNFDAFVFDSLSTLDIYNLGSESERFTRKIINSINAKHSKGVFICLEDDLDCSLVKNSLLSLDTVFQPYLQKDVRSLGGAAAFLLLIIGLPLAAFGGESVSHSTPIGFSVADVAIEQVSSLFVPQLISYLIIILASASFIYRRHFLDPLPESTLLEMKGSSKSRLPVRLVVEKIKNWKKKRN